MVTRVSSSHLVCPLQAYIDSHCHLDFADFDKDRQYMWSSARNAGVIAGVIPGVAPDQWYRARKLAEDYVNLFYSAGVHPWWIDSFLSQNESLDSALENMRTQLDQELDHAKCVALGECGLDKSIATPMARQLEVLDIHFALANIHELPVILHSRKAHDIVLQKLKKTPLPKRGVVHGFSGSYEVAKRFIDNGLFIGVGGTITYPRAQKTREAIRRLPLDSIVLETDAPDMPIEGKQGQRNSPEYIPFIASALAELRKEPLEEIAQSALQNTCALYGLKPAEFGA